MATMKIERLPKIAVASLAAVAISMSAIPKPAQAQSQGTINTILGAVAAVGGIILYNNYVHKRQAANTVVGYTQYGGQVYGDGRIVTPNGQTIYPNANGQYSNGGYTYYAPQANYNQYRYDRERSGRYLQGNNGHHNGYVGGQPYGQWKKQHGDGDDHRYKKDKDDRHDHDHGDR